LVRDPGLNISIRVRGDHLYGTVTNYSERDDWLVFTVPADGVFEVGLDLMHGFDNIPIAGFSRPHPAEAVWKLGAFTGMSVGRVVSVNESDHTFRIDGIEGDEGDSGGAVCLGEHFNACTLVGMVVGGDRDKRVVKAVLADRFVPRIGAPLGPLQRAEELLKRAELEKERAEKELEKERAEKELEKERALRQLAELKLSLLGKNEL